MLFRSIQENCTKPFNLNDKLNKNYISKRKDENNYQPVKKYSANINDVLNKRILASKSTSESIAELLNSKISSKYSSTIINENQIAKNLNIKDIDKYANMYNESTIENDKAKFMYEYKTKTWDIDNEYSARLKERKPYKYSDYSKKETNQFQGKEDLIHQESYMNYDIKSITLQRNCNYE